MERALERLAQVLGDIESPHAYGVAALFAVTRSVRSDKNLFSTPEIRQDFAQQCSNFEHYCHMTGRVQWTAAQFWEWWTHGTVNDAQMLSEIPQQAPQQAPYHTHPPYPCPPMTRGALQNEISAVVYSAEALKTLLRGSVTGRTSSPYGPDTPLKDLFEQLEYCNYECEAGSLNMNAAYIELKRRLT